MPAKRQIHIIAWLHPHLSRVLFFVVGALLMLSFAPFGLYWLAPLLLLPVLLTCLESTPRIAARHCFWFGCGLFLTGTYWLYVSIHVFGEAPAWIAILLMIGLVIVMGFYYAATGWLISRLSDGSVLRLLPVAPAAWVAVEWFRGWFLSGFPWMTLGYAQIDSPLAGLAPLVGVFGVSSVLVFSVAAALAALLRDGKLLWASVAVLPWLLGAGLEQVEWTRPSAGPLRATIVQGGVSQDRKWLPEQFKPTLELYRKATFDNGRHDLIVWPEVAIPAVIDQVDGFLDAMQPALAAARQTLLLGILERKREPERIYNSVLMLDGRSRQIYRKRHLVPFGEFFPVPGFVRKWMRMMSLPYSDMLPGRSEQPLLVTAGGVKLAVAICYEDAYAAEQLYALPEASVLVNVSNDAWFGDSIAPHQHLEIARMRALEAGRYVVRATNNGISAFIGPRGQLLQRGPQFEFVSMSHEVVPYAGLTPYARWGNWPLIAICLAVLGCAGWRQRHSPD